MLKALLMRFDSREGRGADDDAAFGGDKVIATRTSPGKRFYTVPVARILLIPYSRRCS